MGTSHKLKPEIEEFILEQKKVNPELSCRKMSALIKEKFQVELSKSLINVLMKRAGLSSPVGRRRKTSLPQKEPPKIPVETPSVEAPEIPKALEEPVVGGPTAAPEAHEEHKEPLESEPVLLEQREQIEAPLIEEVEKKELVEMPVPEPEESESVRETSRESAPTEIPVETPMEPAQEAPVETPVETPSEPPDRLLELTFKPSTETGVPAAEAAGEIPAEVVSEPVAQVPATPQPVSESPKETHKESLIETHFESSPEIPDLGEGVGGGTVLLKAIDALIGGSYYLTRLVKEQQQRDEPELIGLTEGLIYSPLFKPPIGPDSSLWTLINSTCDFQLLVSYLEELQKNDTLDIDASRMVPKLFQEVLFLDIFLESGEIYHLDAELRSIWSVPNIPYDFALPVNKAKSLINRYFIRNKPIVLFSVPGYDVPTKEFCDFIMHWDSKEKTIAKIALVSNKLDTIETITSPPAGQRYVVFGLWPWQFTKYRRVINIGEFKPFYFEPLDQHFYITESEVTLLQPYTKQSLVFRTCLLKRDPTSKTTLLIGTNIDEDKGSTEEIARLYLSRWPNLDEGFEDYSRKIELFTYTATSRKMFSIESAMKEIGKEPQIQEILNYYLRGMDSYLRWHILPAGYEDFDFPTANQRFYFLKAVFYKKNYYYLVQFYVPKGYNFENDLAYMCRRLNERDVTLRGGKVWFTYIKEQGS